MQVFDTGRIATLAFAAGDDHNCCVPARVDEPMDGRLFKAGLQFATVLLLLFAVTGLSTLSKNSLYFPNSHPTHYVNISSKMKGAPAPVVLERAPLCAIAKVVPPQPFTPRNHGVEEISLPSPSIGVTVSIQHRSPPSLKS
jgi:hypothetical protein